MTNKKSTKRALLVSAMAMVICFTMLLGTTFAWFTDSASSKGNVIKAGELDLTLSAYNGTEYVDISNVTNPLLGGADSIVAQNSDIDTLWEPNKTQVVYLSVKNDGNLDFKFNTALVVENTAGDLYEVIDYVIVKDATPAAPVANWTSGTGLVVGNQEVIDTTILKPNEIYYFALVLHMDKDAGNEYMNGQVTFDINVYATQSNTESDEFNTNYDESQNP